MSEARSTSFERVIKKVVNNTIVHNIITNSNFFNKLKSVRSSRKLPKQRHTSQNNLTYYLSFIIFLMFPNIATSFKDDRSLTPVNNSSRDL